jgi:hypothetical protein
MKLSNWICGIMIALMPLGAHAAELVVNTGEIKIIGSAAARGMITPDRGTVARIEFRGTDPGTYECRIFTLTGEQVWTETKTAAARDTFLWPAQVASGTYVVWVKGPGIKTSKKAVVLR